TGLAYQLLRSASSLQAVGEAAVEPSRETDPQRENNRIERKEPEPLSDPKPEPRGNVSTAPVKAPSPVKRKPPELNSPRHPDPAEYWKAQARHFNKLLEQLENEEDPSRRKPLIRALAGYVRTDTLGTLDWAMGLQDPNERRDALEAISNSSLAGIGARISTDETGFPKILETTILSAIAATGQIQPGDYITGMIDPDGQPISFENLSMRQVVNHLRGEPGSEVQLIMERLPSNENGESYIFDVSVQRSMLVIQPPY
ncbi:MAG TPA: hypothetical protein VLL07_00325, partial [Pontiella sp.]|nr:hypothetical protein [Pontiella sp.]